MNPQKRLILRCVELLRRMASRLQLVFMAGVVMAIDATSAVAEEAAETAEGGKSYGVPWLVIVLVVALGIFITLRPAGRASEIKRGMHDHL